MKKITALFMAIVLCALSFAGCAQKKQVTINSTEDLNGLKIGVQSGTTGQTWCEENTDSEVITFKSGMDAALDLKNGAIDAVVIDELPAQRIVEQNDDLKILDLRFTKEEYAIAVKKGNTELLDSINKTIADMKANGDYDKLTSAFMPADGNIVIPENVAPTSGETLKMGTNAAFWPFEYTEGNEVVGFDITMSQYIAKGYGKQLEVVNMEFDSLIAALQAGSIDFIAAGMSITPDRQEEVDFSEPYYSSEQVVIVRK